MLSCMPPPASGTAGAARSALRAFFALTGAAGFVSVAAADAAACALGRLKADRLRSSHLADVILRGARGAGGGRGSAGRRPSLQRPARGCDGWRARRAAPRAGVRA